MLIPPITQLPIFVGTSMMLSHTAQPPTVFDSESFLTLTSLAHADPTAALPIALGLITLANVESSHWFVDAATRKRRAEQEKANAEKKAQGQIVLEPQKIVQSALRVLSVGRILVGLVVPGVSGCVLSVSLMVDGWNVDGKHVARALCCTGSPPRRSGCSSRGCLIGGRGTGRVRNGSARRRPSRTIRPRLSTSGGKHDK